MHEGVRDVNPLKRNTEVSELGDLALFLCSDMGRGITGDVIANWCLPQATRPDRR